MCLMFILALDHSSLFPAVTNLCVGINVLKNYRRPRVTLLQCGLCCPTLETPPSLEQVRPRVQDEPGEVESQLTVGRGSSRPPTWRTLVSEACPSALWGLTGSPSALRLAMLSGQNWLLCSTHFYTVPLPL